MARKSTARTAEELNAVDKTIDSKELALAGEALTQRGKELSVIDMRFALDGDYDLQRIDSMMPAMSAMHAESMIWLGRALILVKEHEPHGTFHSFLERHNFSIRSAQRYMSVALRCGDSERRMELVNRMGISKAIELLNESDTEIDALVNGGTLADYSLDELDRMSHKELKAALRAERAEREDEKAADEEIIRAKDERINKLTRDKRKGATQDSLRSQANALLSDCDEAAVTVVSLLAKMRALQADVEQLYADAGSLVEPDIDQRMEANLRWAADQLRELAEHLGE